MKLDGDIELRPTTCESCWSGLRRSTLGLAGGVLDEPMPEGGLRRIRVPSHHVHGALKCYSHECFEAIGGVQERLGWDTIDETYARMRGFATVSFTDLVSIHHRPWGTADGALRGRARLGECAYITHYPALWVTLRSLKVACNSPKGVSGVAFLFGYVRAALRRTERVEDPSYRRFTRRELRRRMARKIISPVSRLWLTSGSRASVPDARRTSGTSRLHQRRRIGCRSGPRSPRAPGSANHALQRVCAPAARAQ